MIISSLCNNVAFNGVGCFVTYDKFGIFVKIIFYREMNAVDILRNKRLKKTVQRIMLIKILQKHGIPLTESEIKLEMGDLYDRITFYRTVQKLLEAGIIHRITVDNITVKYALNHSDCGDSENHIHFFCKQCHSVTCLEDIAIPEYQIPKSFRAVESEVLIKGLCDKCHKNGRQS